MKTFLTAVCLGLASFALAGAAHAEDDLGPDEITLKNGGPVRGTIVELEPGDHVAVKMAGRDKPRELRWQQVSDVDRGKYARRRYEGRRERRRRDAAQEAQAQGSRAHGRAAARRPRVRRATRPGEVLEEEIAGFYHRKRDKLHVRNVAQGDAKQVALAKAILAHEVHHARQARHFDLGGPPKRRRGTRPARVDRRRRDHGLKVLDCWLDSFRRIDGRNAPVCQRLDPK